MKKDCPSVQQNYRSDKRQRERASRAKIEGHSLKRSRRTHSTDANYPLQSALSGTIQTNCDTWLIDSSASRHMTGYQELLSDLAKRESYQNVILGDDARYAVKGVGATSFQLKSRKTFKMKDVLHVPGMTSKLVVVSALEDEGYDVIFFRGRVYIQRYGSSERVEIGIRDGGLYRLTLKLLKALLHDTISPIELWHRRLAHLDYRALPTLRKVTTGFPEFGDQRNGVSHNCALGKNDKRLFQSVTVGSRGFWTLFIQIYVDRCQLLLSVDIHTL